MTKTNKGVTIVEIILYVGLISIFIISLVEVFVTAANFKLESESASTIQSDSQFIFSKLMNDVMEADSISQPGTLGTTANSLTFSSGGVIYTYSLNIDGDLIRSRTGESLKLNSLDTKLTSITFKRLGNTGDPPTVQVNCDVESRITKQGGVVDTRSFQTTLGLR